ncbi:hypothetical protein MUU53_22115 [Rhizobium lemnae]|uniref:Uncharacterized protein n=1 Tax=Rhizobium lemnae TaxID=1214924 RepID=A0ABV8EES9_9HYPH|nr:hypothetical protein [Rhizobium lemnae]MCJ8510561.1 hypothetical protein [Rhizobium lemnae]
MFRPLAEAAGWVATAIGVTAAGYGAYKGGEYLANQMAQADEAADNAGASSAADACVTCTQNPCAALACGAPGSKYRGGAHGCMTGTTDTKGDKLDSHHTPAAANSNIHREVSTAIQMDPKDHRQTSSYGGGRTTPYMAGQKRLVDGDNFMGAIAMDIADIRRIAAKSGDPSKYDDAIRQMLQYARCLKQNGIIH